MSDYDFQSSFDLNLVNSDMRIINKRQNYMNKSSIENMQNASRTDSKYFSEHLIDCSLTENNNPIELNNNFIINPYEAQTIINASNMFSKNYIYDNRFTKFAKYGIMDLYNEHTFSREYLFFTKPDLHIMETGRSGYLYKPLSQLPFFIDALRLYPQCIYSLQQTLPSETSVSKTKYMPILSNQVSSCLALPTIAATETGGNVNLYQFGINNRDGSEISDCNVEFSLEFKDTKYLDVYMLFKIYDEYVRETYKRDILPTKISYIDNKIDSKSFSVYKIIVDDTNTVMYYAKITGVYPMSVPRDAMSGFDGSGIKETIQFKGQFVRDMDPIIIQELNLLTCKSLGLDTNSDGNISIQKNYVRYAADDDKSETYYGHGHVNTTWGTCPLILQSNAKKTGASMTGNGENYLYKLFWVK